MSTSLYEKQSNGAYALMGGCEFPGVGEEMPRINRSGVSDATAVDVAEEETEVEVDERPYEEWSYAELKEQCGIRGLSKGGSAEELAFRLLEDDEEEEAEDEE